MAGALVQAAVPLACFTLMVVASTFRGAQRAVQRHNEQWPLVPGFAHTRAAPRARVRVPGDVADDGAALAAASAALLDAEGDELVPLAPSGGALHVGTRFAFTPGLGFALAPTWAPTASGERPRGGVSEASAQWTTGRLARVRAALAPAPGRAAAPLALVASDKGPPPGVAFRAHAGADAGLGVRALAGGGLRLGPLRAHAGAPGLRLGDCAEGALCAEGDVASRGRVQLSDARRKRVLGPAPGNGSAPRAVTFRWRAAPGDPRRAGFVAQELPWRPGARRVAAEEALADAFARLQAAAARVARLEAARGAPTATRGAPS